MASWAGPFQVSSRVSAMDLPWLHESMAHKVHVACRMLSLIQATRGVGKSA